MTALRYPKTTNLSVVELDFVNDRIERLDPTQRYDEAESFLRDIAGELGFGAGNDKKGGGSNNLTHSEFHAISINAGVTDPNYVSKQHLIILVEQCKEWMERHGSSHPQSDSADIMELLRQPEFNGDSTQDALSDGSVASPMESAAGSTRCSSPISRQRAALDTIGEMFELKNMSLTVATAPCNITTTDSAPRSFAGLLGGKKNSSDATVVDEAADTEKILAMFEAEQHQRQFLGLFLRLGANDPNDPDGFGIECLTTGYDTLGLSIDTVQEALHLTKRQMMNLLSQARTSHKRAAQAALQAQANLLLSNKQQAVTAGATSFGNIDGLSASAPLEQSYELGNDSFVGATGGSGSMADSLVFSSSPMPTNRVNYDEFEWIMLHLKGGELAGITGMDATFGSPLTRASAAARASTAGQGGGKPPPGASLSRLKSLSKTLIAAARFTNILGKSGGESAETLGEGAGSVPQEQTPKNSAAGVPRTLSMSPSMLAKRGITPPDPLLSSRQPSMLQRSPNAQSFGGKSVPGGGKSVRLPTVLTSPEASRAFDEASQNPAGGGIIGTMDQSVKSSANWGNNVMHRRSNFGQQRGGNSPHPSTGANATTPHRRGNQGTPGSGDDEGHRQQLAALQEKITHGDGTLDYGAIKSMLGGMEIQPLQENNPLHYSQSRSVQSVVGIDKVTSVIDCHLPREFYSSPPSGDHHYLTQTQASITGAQSVTPRPGSSGYRQSSTALVPVTPTKPSSAGPKKLIDRPWRSRPSSGATVERGGGRLGSASSHQPHSSNMSNSETPQRRPATGSSNASGRPPLPVSETLRRHQEEVTKLSQANKKHIQSQQPQQRKRSPPRIALVDSATGTRSKGNSPVSDAPDPDIVVQNCNVGGSFDGESGNGTAGNSPVSASIATTSATPRRPSHSAGPRTRAVKTQTRDPGPPNVAGTGLRERRTRGPTDHTPVVLSRPPRGVKASPVVVPFSVFNDVLSLRGAMVSGSSHNSPQSARQASHLQQSNTNQLQVPRPGGRLSPNPGPWSGRSSGRVSPAPVNSDRRWNNNNNNPRASAASSQSKDGDASPAGMGSLAGAHYVVGTPGASPRSGQSSAPRTYASGFGGHGGVEDPVFLPSSAALAGLPEPGVQSSARFHKEVMLWNRCDFNVVKAHQQVQEVQ